MWDVLVVVSLIGVFVIGGIIANRFRDYSERSKKQND